MQKIKRVIPCLDVKDGRVVKGTNFVELKDAGDPVEFAKLYNNAQADELVFLDITATAENRDTIVDVVKRTAAGVTIPFAVGGGIRTIDDIKKILDSGADKVSLGTAAVKNPDLIAEAAKIFGSERVILALDAKKIGDNKWEVYINGGQVGAGLDVLEWAEKAVALGAGEVLLTSMDKDGVQDGYDLELTRAVAERVNVPVIASGGAGELEHFYQAVTEGKADAVLAASVFHFQKFSIREVKEYLKSRGVEVKL
ncbi:MAG: imidazole glycerol phosphate synthase subunit HisF [Sporomusaceae bacterium]|jgi:cyclase|nr:imidazole glycerol phosphate synthase subunit HisF [Sporomusaceae bacterium]